MSKTISAQFVHLLAILALVSGCASTLPVTTNQDEAGTMRAYTHGMQAHRGFINFYWDATKGRVLLEINKFDAELLYVTYLARGVGSNDLGLDRGQIGHTRIVTFQRVGPKVLMIEPNYSFRAISDNPDEQKAIRESFASSVIWAFKVEHESGTSVLVDATGFLARDAHGLARRLQRAGEGSYTVDPERSAFYAPRSRAFERNTELEFSVTFAGEPAGNQLPQVTPTPQALTIHMHHSFVALPDDEYRPRAFDPRSGYFGISFADYASPIHAPLTKRFIARHRLQKQNPDAPVSAAVEPIVYYVDAGAPSPVREALIEGARWWAEAFEAIGYKDAFRVEVLPAGADPLDVRYNVIQWVHRATRGWSYGASVIDPRSGEIIKGHVSLGSLRVRQDFLLAEGLLAPYADDGAVPPELLEMALARLRQLSAHEVGHTLGLNHNFAASMEDRASVMDYPHPLVTLAGDGSLDLSRAYGTGVGAWDRYAIEFGYQDFPDTVDEAVALKQIVAAAIARGQQYVVDEDARTPGAAHPLGHLWDNGSDVVAEFRRLLAVRGQVLRNFSASNIPVGAPLATLEEVLVPMYLMHRYQAEAVAKLLGGQYYSYALRGDGQEATRAVPGHVQREALNALLATLSADTLLLPENLLSLIPGRPPGYAPHRELFQRRTGPVFDAFAPAESAAGLVVSLMLQPERANRMVVAHALDTRQPGLDEVLERLIAASWLTTPAPGATGDLQRLVDHVVLAGIMRLAAHEQASELTREIAYGRLNALAIWLERRAAREGRSPASDHYRYGNLLIRRFLDDPLKHAPVPAPALPPGSPIGDASLQSFFSPRQM